MGEVLLVAVVRKPSPGQPLTYSVPLEWSPCPSLSFLICRGPAYYLSLTGPEVLSSTHFSSVVLSFSYKVIVRERKVFCPAFTWVVPHLRGTPRLTGTPFGYILLLVGGRARERLGRWLGRAPVRLS